MPEFTLTDEQLAIIEAAKATKDNLAVIARAGAAKTTTLVELAKAMPEEKILCLAFNKKIAQEMTERLPENCTAKTLHGLGYNAWRQFIAPKIKLTDRKVYQLLRNFIDQIEDKEEKAEAFEMLAETLDIIKKGKQLGWLPDRYVKAAPWKSLLDDAHFFDNLPMEPSALQCEMARHVSIASYKLALEGEIDFDDMIMCPALAPVSWPTFPLVMVDEAQDLSSLNHFILRKLVKRNRLIAVGDPCQAIYGFRGANEDSMNDMIKQFDMSPLYLTVSFRCSKAVTENARWLAPDMQSPDWAVPGSVIRPVFWEASDLKEGDAIICRNNAPLFTMAIKLIEQDRLPEIAGRDIAGPLVKLMKKLGKPVMLSAAALDAVNHWEEVETKRARKGAKGGIRDRAEVIRIMLRRTKTLGDDILYLEHLLQRDGRIHLMTGHKSKGLEYDRVWFLDSHLCNLDEGQDKNIKYVIETRAKNQLAYVSRDTFVTPDEEG
jgi:DNA helicase-2/ATP-dependent DNA helicase PcrA